VRQDALTDRRVLLHLPSFIECECSCLFEQAW
jgi:hypothetical protein